MSKFESRWNSDDPIDSKNPLYDRSVIKVVLLASVLIIFSMLLVGVISYVFTEKEVIKKLKDQDLNYIAQSISSKVEGRIERAKETAMILADDPAMMKWIQSEEKDQELGGYALEKLHMLANNYDYSNSFIVSSTTNHYWGENGQILQTMSKDNPEQVWFFETLASKNKAVVVVDYDIARNETSVFVNVLIGHVDKPLGIAGVGLSLKELSDDFQNYKYGEKSRLWMIDQKGTVHLSDNFDNNGKSIEAYTSPSTKNKLIENFGQAVQIFESKDQEGQQIDLISYPIPSMDMRLVFQIPRDETVYFLRTIKLNTAVAILIALISIIFFFYYVTRKLANPYQRALKLNKELESQVSARTMELEQRNDEIMDSITYAKRIQESLLPSIEQMDILFEQHFIIWKPRDVVGGDFYWFKQVGEHHLIAIGDCTGHGVPGAFMTMLTISLLNRIVDHEATDDPALIMQKLNQLIKETLNQKSKNGRTDDGLDLGLVLIRNDKLTFAGAGCSIYVQDDEGVRSIKGDRKSIGYRRTPGDYTYTSQMLQVKANSKFYMATDGVFDQSGGEKGYSYGKSRLLKFIQEHSRLSLSEQEKRFEEELTSYMGKEAQRDDMTFLAFEPRRYGGSEI
jgi:serine phosphatase RsbU (regulator of sigma subunit)